MCLVGLARAADDLSEVHFPTDGSSPGTVVRTPTAEIAPCADGKEFCVAAPDYPSHQLPQVRRNVPVVSVQCTGI